MTRFEHLIDALCLMARARIDLVIDRAAGSAPSDAWDGPHLWSALEHAAMVGEIDARSGITLARSPFDADGALDEAYTSRYGAVSRELIIESACPPNPAGHVLYCPRGCNQLRTTSSFDECGACGSVMRVGGGAEKEYYDSLIAAGQCQ